MPSSSNSHRVVNTSQSGSVEPEALRMEGTPLVSTPDLIIVAMGGSIT
ncbi:MAG: hypothetical protein P1S60_11725 [Anaerolineae bacterium]|nr:hypothetical protein [Anaerolineae bacterium]